MLKVPRETRERRKWDSPTRSENQERFYRELMATDELPSPPEIAQRVMVAVNREDSNANKLSQLIARDQSLTARLLRLANSAFFAVRAHVTSIPQAVTLLGFMRVRDIALGLSVWGAFDIRDPLARRYRQRLWSHTAAVAAAAKLIAERTGADPAEAFAAGLLHDVGKLVLGVRLGKSYWEMLDEAVEREMSAATLEGEIFGCHHGTVGAWLLQLWQLPATLVDPVAMHHDPLEPAFGMDLTSIVSVANRLVDATDGSSGDLRNEVLDEIRCFAPGVLAADTWREMYAGLAREQQAVAGMFDG